MQKNRRLKFHFGEVIIENQKKCLAFQMRISSLMQGIRARGLSRNEVLHFLLCTYIVYPAQYSETISLRFKSFSKFSSQSFCHYLSLEKKTSLISFTSFFEHEKNNTVADKI